MENTKTTTDKFFRLVAIHQIFKSGYQLSVKDLTKRCCKKLGVSEISEPTIYRDLDFLEDYLNAPLASKNGIHYYTDLSFTIDFDKLPIL